jgi:prepilin-type N-terminal cleavage/methylation domain
LRGFSLIELMVALAIMSVLLGFALPAFQSMSLSANLRSNANTLVASAQLARSEAIKRNAVVQLCVSGDGATCGSGGWEKGWIVLASDNTVLHAEPALDDGYVVTATKEGTSTAVTTLRFPSSGVGLKLNAETDSATAEFRLCRLTPTVGEQERKVRVSTTGRTSVDKTNEGTCSAS